MKKLALIFGLALVFISCEKGNDKQGFTKQPEPYKPILRMSSKTALIKHTDWQRSGNIYTFKVDIPVGTNDKGEQLPPDSLGVAYGKTYQDFEFQFPHHLHDSYVVSYVVKDWQWVITLVPNTPNLELDNKYSFIKFIGVYYFRY